MTLTSGLIGGVLAATTAPAPNWGYFAWRSSASSSRTPRTT